MGWIVSSSQHYLRRRGSSKPISPSFLISNIERLHKSKFATGSVTDKIRSFIKQQKTGLQRNVISYILLNISLSTTLHTDCSSQSSRGTSFKTKPDLSWYRTVPETKLKLIMTQTWVTLSLITLKSKWLHASTINFWTGFAISNHQINGVKKQHLI